MDSLTHPPIGADPPEVNSEPEQPPPPIVGAAPSKPKSARLISLDAFRGLTIILMLLVNNVALDIATPKHLQHAAWNGGIHAADLVFPWFLFCVGVAIPFSVAASRRKALPWWQQPVHIVRRTIILVFLGCLLNSAVARTPFFSLGVLQLIGLAYMVGAFFYYLRMPYRLSIAAILLIGYWAAIKFVPVPNVGTGVFEEGRNLIAHINTTYLASIHLSGLMSVVPTAGLVLLGTGIGDLLMREEMRHTRKVLWLVLAGAVLTGIGVAWNLSLPYNKPFWTPSYIVYSAGTGTLGLTLFFLVIDVWKWKWWAYPLQVFGANAIVGYVAPILLKTLILQVWTVKAATGVVTIQQYLLQSAGAWKGIVGGGWVYTIGYIVFWWMVLWILYRKRIFLRV